MWVQSLGQEDPLERGTATHSSILAWRILWTEEPGRLQSMGPQRVGRNWATFTHSLMHILVLTWWLDGKESACQCKRCGFDPWVGKIPWRRKWQPTPVFLPGKSHGQRSLAGYVHGVTKSQTRLKQLSTAGVHSEIIQELGVTLSHIRPHRLLAEWQEGEKGT